MKQSLLINIKYRRLTAIVLPVILILATCFLSADVYGQTVNKRLYLKTGSGLNRVVPTSATVSSSAALVKQSAVLGVSGNVTTGNSGSTTGSLASAAITPSGTNRLLLVSVGSVVGVNNAVSSVTFGGVAMTKLTESISGSFKIEFWYLKNPNAAAGAVQINWPAGNTLEASVGISALYNVDLINTFTTTASLAGTGGTSSLTVPSTAGDIIVDAVAIKDNAFSAAAGQTELYNAGTNSVNIRSSWRAAATGTATSTNMSWSGLTGSWVTVGVGVKGISNDVVFTQNPAMCSNFTIRGGQTITVMAHAAVTANTASGTSLPVSAELSYGSTIVFSSLTATNAGLAATGSTGTLTWTGTIPSDVTIPAGQPLILTFSSEYSLADIRIDHDATTKVSYVELPTSTYININSLQVFNAAYSGGSAISQQSIGVTNYIRAVVSDPFGFDDITGLDIRINGGSALAATSVATSGCTRTYEYSWTPTVSGAYTIQATAKEGTENTVTHVATSNFTVVRPSVSVVKTKTAPSGPHLVNDNVTYNIAVTNTGLSALTTVPLQDIFNTSSLQYVSASPAPGTIAAGVLSWSNLATGSLAAGATTNVSVTFKIISNANPVNNTARVENAVDNLSYVAAAASNTVSITVSNIPDAIVDRYAIQASTALDVLGNDTDADVTGSLATNNSLYNLIIETAPAVGTATVTAGKTIQFNPAGMAEDQSTTFKYRVTEISTGLWDTATVFIRYSSVNNLPVALNDVASTTVNDPITINILANDYDVDGNLQTPTITVAPQFGTVVMNANNTITYTPYSGFTGNDVLTYRICDDGTPTPSQCATATVTISVANAIIVCQESANTFTVSAVQGAVSYIWTLPAGATVTSAHTGTLPNPVTTSTSITINWNGVTPGLNSICAKPTNNCGDGTSQCVDVYITKVSTSTAVMHVACRGGATGAIDLTVTGGKAPYTYSWTGPSGFTATIEDINNLIAGTYNVTITDKYGCVATVSVTVSQPATSVGVTGVVTNENPYGATNGAIDITASGGTAPYTYSWSTGSVMEDISNLAGGFYSVVVTDTKGCSITRNFTVTYVGGPLIISSITKTDVKCYNASTGTIDLEVIGGSGTYTYSWTGPSGFSASTQDLASLPSGTYNVTVSDGSGTVTGSATINQPAVGISATSAASNVSCYGGSNGNITLTVSGGTAPYTYLWNNGASTKDLTGITAGSYTVAVTDANGCTTTATRVISQPASAVSATEVVVNSTCTTGNTGSITITPTGGTGPYTYAWSNGAITKDITTLAPGSYSVIITDAAGCTLGKSFVVSNSCIGVAKSIAATPTNNTNGSYTLTYNIKVENKGNVAVSNIQVTDNLTNTFVGATSFSISSVSSGSFTVNNSYNGTSNTNLLAAPLGTLAPGESKFIAVTVVVVPGSKLGVYNNTATATALDASGVAVSDNSHNGTNTDPDGDGNPGNNNAPTPVTFTENPIIAVAKRVTTAPVNNLDGSYNVVYTITVKNMGNVPLKNVQVTDNFATTFAGAPVSVISLTSSLLTVNNSFNGITNINLLAGNDNLAVNEIRTLIVSVRVRPNSLSTYNNTAVATAQGPGGTTTTDNSNDGVEVDPNNNGDPTDNNDPTPVTFTEAPVIGVAKRVGSKPINLNNGSYAVLYSFIVKNTGNVPLKNVQVTDDLSSAFGGKPVTVDSVRTSSNLTRNNAYNGIGNVNLLTGLDSLAIGEIATVNLYIKVTPGTNLGVYYNSATGLGNGPLGTPASDVSNNGTDTDPENDGPANNSIPTPLSFTESPQIGIAKAVSNPVNNGNGTYSLTYNIKVTNTGDVPLQNVQVEDDLAATFAGATTFTVTGVTASGTLTANNAYNGTTNKNLVTTPNGLAVGVTSNIAIQVNVTPGTKLGIYDNHAFASGTSPGGAVVRDTSTNGSSVDPDGDGNPGNNDTLTPVQFVEVPRIGVAKRVFGTVTNNGNGTHTLTYEIKVQNMGDVPLTNLQLADDLTATFPSPVTFVVNSLVVHQQPASSTLVTNGSYNGAGNSNLLNGSGTLATGETAILKLTITVNPGALGGPFYNSANGFGTSPAGVFVFDRSQDGMNVDVNSDGDATDDNDPTPVSFFENPGIGIAKRVVSVIDSTGGINKVTFQLKIRNYGDVELRDVRIYDDIVTRFAAVTPANFTAMQGSLFANSSWNGTATSNILAAGQSLAVGDSGNVFISFTVIPGTVVRLDNIGTTQGSTLSGKVVTDTSTDGINPDPTLDGDPRNDSIPTPVIFSIKKDTDKDGINDENDIDDDNDGITDFIELCGSGASTFSCTPGGNDPAKDDDNDGIVNYKDGDWGTLNAAGCVASMDADGDGIPNHLDLDSDNDGVQDVIEAGGVDENGDGIIDNYCDVDADGLSQNVDANTTGEPGSGFALGFVDFDLDGIPNALDLDSDNDGVPDIVESAGTDTNNDGRIDGYADTDNDGWSNQYDGDADGNGTVENLANVLVLSMADPAYVNCGSPGTGRPVCYALRGNYDGQGLPNFIDLDSDGDGITDATESGLMTATYTRSMVSGCTLVNGWCSSISAMAALDLTNTDNQGRLDLYDIDSDNDGITDNVEAQPTGSNVVPADADTDGDGLVNVYDFYNGVGGNGLTPYDHDADGTPDYRDLDTDNDGAFDRNEGDKRFLSLTQATIDASGDTDGDGLMDYFDVNQLAASCSTGFANVGMSNFGSNGNFSGPAPGASLVQLVQSSANAPDRDWRNSQILPLKIISLSGILNGNTAQLNWKVSQDQDVKWYVIDRGLDGIHFNSVGTVRAINGNNLAYSYNDPVGGLTTGYIYYRIKQVSKNGSEFTTSVIRLKPTASKVEMVVYPNPVITALTVAMESEIREVAKVVITNLVGKVIANRSVPVEKGINHIVVNELATQPSGSYFIKVILNQKALVEKVMKQ